MNIYYASFTIGIYDNFYIIVINYGGHIFEYSLSKHINNDPIVLKPKSPIYIIKVFLIIVIININIIKYFVNFEWETTIVRNHLN